MRTTLDIADDVLEAAKELGRRQHKTAGQVLSELAREALNRPAAPADLPPAEAEPEEFLGFRPFPNRGGVVTNELVSRLRDEESVRGPASAEGAVSGDK